MSSLPAKIIAFFITTLCIALIYGLYSTTMDFMAPNYDPIASGHKAASNVYGVFGTATQEIKRNEINPRRNGQSIARKIAEPYAIVADLSAIWGGKIEISVSSLIHSTQSRS